MGVQDRAEETRAAVKCHSKCQGAPRRTERGITWVEEEPVYLVLVASSAIPQSQDSGEQVLSAEMNLATLHGVHHLCLGSSTSTLQSSVSPGISSPDQKVKKGFLTHFNRQDTRKVIFIAGKSASQSS